MEPEACETKRRRRTRELGQMCVPSREEHSRRFNVCKSCFRPFLCLILSVEQPFFATCLSLFATCPASSLPIVGRWRRLNNAAFVVTLFSISAVPSKCLEERPLLLTPANGEQVLLGHRVDLAVPVSELEHRSTFDEEMFYFPQM